MLFEYLILRSAAAVSNVIPASMMPGRKPLPHFSDRQCDQRAFHEEDRRDRHAVEQRELRVRSEQKPQNR
jgi:hypothetical protein